MFLTIILLLVSLFLLLLLHKISKILINIAKCDNEDAGNVITALYIFLYFRN